MIDSAAPPRVALVAPKGNRELARQLGMRRLQRHLDLTGKDLILVSRSRPLRVRAREEGLPAVGRLSRVDFDRPGGAGLQLGWVTLRLPTIGALLALALFTAAVAAGAVVLLWYVPTAQVTVYLPARPETETVDLSIDARATELNVARAVVPARRREITLTRTLPGPATGQVSTPTEVAAVGLSFINRTAQPITVPKGTVVRSTTGVAFTVGNDVALLGRPGATGDAIALAQVAGSAGNVPPNTVTGVDGPLAPRVTVTNPNPGEKGADFQHTVVSENDILFIRRLAEAYLADAARREIEAQYGDQEAVFTDGLRIEIIDANPIPPIGQAARYAEAAVTARVSLPTVAKDDLRRVWRERVLPRLPSSRMLLEDTFDAKVERAGAPDQTFDRLPVTMRLSGQSTQRVDPDELRASLAGRSPAGADRLVRDRLEIDASPAVSLPDWAPWLPRKEDRIGITFRAEN
ncbi:MAG: baseplate J/gp47 family protein [Dehalococcoidia bacterium]